MNIAGPVKMSPLIERSFNDGLKLLEEMCENDIQIFKTDQVEEHMGDKDWNEKYCEFIYLEDTKNR